MFEDIYCSVIIVAAGQGRRMGTEISKQFIEIDGKPLIAYTLKKFQDCSAINEIVIVTQKDSIEFCKKDIVEKYGISKVTRIVEGGSERQFSVYNGINTVSSETKILLIHDGVRPFVTEKNITDTIKGALMDKACILGVRATDTIKIADRHGVIVNTPNRASLWHIQTPQTFKYDIIKSAYEKAFKEDFIATDDSMIVENAGFGVHVIEGNYSNIKVTTIDDMIMVKELIKKQFSDWR